MNGECELKSIIGDKRIAELALVGEVLKDQTSSDLISYHGKFPLWKRIVVGLNSIRVSLIMLCHCWILASAATHSVTDDCHANVYISSFS